MGNHQSISEVRTKDRTKGVEETSQTSQNLCTKQKTTQKRGLYE